MYTYATCAMRQPIQTVTLVHSHRRLAPPPVHPPGSKSSDEVPSSIGGHAEQLNI
jgi:hypothetical protein